MKVLDRYEKGVEVLWLALALDSSRWLVFHSGRGVWMETLFEECLPRLQANGFIKVKLKMFLGGRGGKSDSSGGGDGSGSAGLAKDARRFHVKTGREGRSAGWPSPECSDVPAFVTSVACPAPALVSNDCRVGVLGS